MTEGTPAPCLFVCLCIFLGGVDGWEELREELMIALYRAIRDIEPHIHNTLQSLAVTHRERYRSHRVGVAEPRVTDAIHDS